MPVQSNVPTRISKSNSTFNTEATQSSSRSSITSMADRRGDECGRYQARLHPRQKVVQHLIDKNQDDLITYRLCVFLYKLLGDKIYGNAKAS